MVDTQLDALAVDTRRSIFDMLLVRPRSVSEIAAALPVSRPAVSQHLRVLLDAELVRVTVVGNRHVYSADPTGMAALRGWVDQMWEMAMGSFESFARKEMEATMRDERSIEPVVKTITVPGSPAMVFELFTSRIDEWWPASTHSVAGDDVTAVKVDPGVGGRVYEVTNAGVEHEWGRIVEWEPAARIAFTWYPGLPVAQATHVEITFRADAEGTELTLVHDGWAARGDDAEQMRAGYDTGWDVVLAKVPGSTPAVIPFPG